MAAPQSRASLPAEVAVMLWTVAMGLQAAAGPPEERPRAVRAPPPAACDAAQGDEVVVCGRRDQEAFRLRPLPQGFERDPGLPPAALSIGGVGVSAETEAGQAAGGGAPPRAMIRLKVPL